MLEMIPHGDTVIPVLRPGYPVVQMHTPDNPFCSDRTCPCHEQDEASLAKVQQWYQEGLISAQDATEIVMGRRAW